MGVSELLHALPLPDPRPARANPDERKKRKEYEKEHPHFQMQEFGLKAGVLALMGAVAVYPWEKKYDEHVAKHHPERLDKGKDKGGEKGKEGRDGRDGREKGRRRSVGDGDIEVGRGPKGRHVDVDNTYSRAGDSPRRSRRMSVADASYRPPPTYIESNRRNSRAPSSDGRRKTYIDDAALPQAARRRSVDRAALRMAVADGYEYISSAEPFPDREHLERRRSVDGGREGRYVYEDGYKFRPRRVTTMPSERGDRRMR